MDKLKISRVIVVEGKYDKIKLDSLVDAQIITTDGFGIFRKDGKRELIRRLAEARGLIVLCDSDGAGKLIRSALAGCVDPDRIVDLYTPKISGKERRKSAPSKEGILGVEGMDAELLRSLLAPFADGAWEEFEEITKLDFYKYGLSGVEGAENMRQKVAKAFGLPADLTANALIKALNVLGGKPALEAEMKKIKEQR